MSPLPGGSLFDVMGPVMIGPSSSHTAGAVRLARLAHNAAGQDIVSVDFVLYNSFAKTYQGHGTDRGLLAGILGLDVDAGEIREAYAIAEQAGLEYRFTPFLEPNAFPPNTVKFVMTLADRSVLEVVGHSIGGGKVIVTRIGDFQVNLRGEYPTVVMAYHDQPGMIWQVTKIIAEDGINIASLACTRRTKGTEAFMAIALDTLLPAARIADIQTIPGVYSVRNVDKITA